MPTVEIDGKKITATAGETILEACRRAGIAIPTLCHLPGLSPSGACRICVVELEGRGLVPSCAQPVAEGDRIQTCSPRVHEARRTIVELLLSGHPDDCLYCPRNGSCELQALARSLGVSRRRLQRLGERKMKDVSSAALQRDPAKCILCGRCVRVCEEIQGVGAIDFVGRGAEARIATAFEEGLNVASCVSCGQCVAHCPTAALTEKSDLERVLAALADERCLTVVQHAPAVAVTIADDLPESADAAGLLNAALRRVGFDRVYETAFAADLTVMEEASELLERLAGSGPLPLFSSCSPAWVSYVEQRHPELLDHLSSCKSPQQMLGALLKSAYAPQQGIEVERIFSVAVMPCTAKKFEAARAEHAKHGRADIDAALTTRELIKLLELRGVELARLASEPADSPLGQRSSAGRLFGVTGGVTEAALRTAHFLATNEALPSIEFAELRGLEGVKQAQVEIAGKALSVVVVSGLANAEALIGKLQRGELEAHFVEVMSCPGGCIAGGGQPHGAALRERALARMKRLYAADRNAELRCAHDNPEIKALYRDFLERPLSSTSHALLHTHYAPRVVVR